MAAGDAEASPVTARLAAGQPPLRVGELATLLGYSRETVRKWLDAGVVEAVRGPDGGERRVPVGAALRLAQDLRVV